MPTSLAAQEEADDRLVRKLQQRVARSEEKDVIALRHGVLPAIAALWLGTAATADAQKLTVDVIITFK